MKRTLGVLALAAVAVLALQDDASARGCRRGGCGSCANGACAAPAPACPSGGCTAAVTTGEAAAQPVAPVADSAPAEKPATVSAPASNNNVATSARRFGRRGFRR